MKDLYMLCGKTGAGKTSYGKALESRVGGIKFTIDEWMIRLFGHDMEREIFDQRLSACKEVILELSLRLMRMELPVILDFGFWKWEERERVRSAVRSIGGSCKLLYFKVDDLELKSRLRKRNAELPAGTYRIDDDMFDLFSGWFEPPRPDETPILVTDGFGTQLDGIT